jgi:hypothetical protein
VAAFCIERGFDVCFETDLHSGGRPEMVIGYPHYWEFMVAVRSL